MNTFAIQIALVSDFWPLNQVGKQRIITLHCFLVYILLNLENDLCIICTSIKRIEYYFSMLILSRKFQNILL